MKFLNKFLVLLFSTQFTIGLVTTIAQAQTTPQTQFSTQSISQTQTITCDSDIVIDAQVLKTKTGIELSAGTTSILTTQNQDFVSLVLGTQTILPDQIIQFDFLDWKSRTIVTWPSTVSSNLLQFVVFQKEAKARLQIVDEDMTEDLAIFKNCRTQ